MTDPGATYDELVYGGAAPIRESPAALTANTGPSRVSVILPAFNAVSFLREAADGVRIQAGPDWELLIVDDGSSDGTRALADEISAADPARIRRLSHPDSGNHGVAASRNLALLHAAGDLIAFLDADDRWAPGKLERQVAFMRAHPDVGLSYTRATVAREGVGTGFMPELAEIGAAPPASSTAAFMQIAIGVMSYAFSSVMVRREALQSAGAFEERLPFQNEDRLMAARVAARHRVGFVDEPLCAYRAHPGAYTTRATLDGLAPLIFLDLQVRLVRWLRRAAGLPELGRRLASIVMPVCAAEAVALSWRRAEFRGPLARCLRMLWVDDPRACARLILRALSRRRGDRHRSDAELRAAGRTLANRLRAAGIASVFLYGAGGHTIRLLSARALEPLSVAGILDDFAGQASIAGRPVLRPRDARIPSGAAVIVSSDTLQSRLFDQARRHGLAPIYRLYSL